MLRVGDGHVWVLYVNINGQMTMQGAENTTTGRDLPVSKDEEVEKPGGLLDHCRCW